MGSVRGRSQGRPAMSEMRRKPSFHLAGMIPTCDPLVFSPEDSVSVDTVYGAARSGAKRCWNI